MTLSNNKEASALSHVVSVMIEAHGRQRIFSGHRFERLLELQFDRLGARLAAVEGLLCSAHHTLRRPAHADDRRVRERQLEAMRRAHLASAHAQRGWLAVGGALGDARAGSRAPRARVVPGART